MLKIICSIQSNNRPYSLQIQSTFMMFHKVPFCLPSYLHHTQTHAHIHCKFTMCYQCSFHGMVLSLSLSNKILIIVILGLRYHCHLCYEPLSSCPLLVSCCQLLSCIGIMYVNALHIHYQLKYCPKYLIIIL